MPKLPDISWDTSSPKRKRSPATPTPPDSSPTSNMRVTTSIPGMTLLTEEERGQNSPRTKVAYNFQGLHLGDSGSDRVSKLDLGRSSRNTTPEEEDTRKRVKMFLGQEEPSPGDVEIPETPDASTKKIAKDLPIPEAQRSFTIRIPSERTIDPIVAKKAGNVILHNDVDPVIFTSGSSLSKIKSAGSARLSDSKSRPGSQRKRAGTPPLSNSTKESGSHIVDPVRAALTWHEDEITGHNPTDPDDDGEGINGIGFKPTPAEAYARAQKRKQQMDQYRSREAKEARARRSERRRGSEKIAEERDKEGERKVRFQPEVTQEIQVGSE